VSEITAVTIGEDLLRFA